MARPTSCRIGFKSLPSPGAGIRRAKGLDVRRMKSVNATAIQAWTASTFAFSVSGRLRPKVATSAEKNTRISSHKSIDPSWFPHTPEIL
ncbi:hypothetical protein D3C86_2083310 [compost metagenome]